jgi:hypothetical protein
VQKNLERIERKNHRLKGAVQAAAISEG